MLRTYLEYNTVVRLCHFFVVAGKLILYKFSCSIQIFFFLWFWREIVFGVTYVLSVQYSCAVVLVFLLWLFGVMYVLSVQYSCAVVSFFLL